MIKVKLKPEQGIKVRLTPSQSAEVSLKTVYLYDPDWIPEINKAVSDAKESADNAKVSEQNAAQSASDADADATNAAESATIAYNSEQNAIAQANKATEEANAAAESAYQAQTSALAAHEYASNAEADAQNALETLGHVLEAETNATNAATTAIEQAGIATEKATEAGTHATNASVSETNAKTSEDNAKNHELSAKGYSETATQEANASAESAYQSQQSALASAQYASDAESDAQNALETLGHVLESETISTNAANTATQKAQEASESAADAQESAEEAQRIKDSLGNIYVFKGSVATFEDLPTNASVGDVYDVLDTGKNYAWDGSKWDDIGGTVDLSAYAKTAYVDGREQAIREDYMQADSDLQTQINGQATAITEAQGDIVDLQNNKQDVISDLDTIRSGAVKGATAVQPSDLSAVATSGSYNDLTNKPTIPTVNNGVLTIQKNGIQVATFSANQSGNVTANIEADTQVNADWNATSGVAQILNKPTLSTVSTSGSYNDLTNKPTIPTATSQLTNDSDYTTKNYVDTTEQEIIENYMQADTDLQTQITGLSTALTTAQGNITTINSKIPTSASSSNLLITNTELTNATQSVRSDFADADSELQTQITGLSGTVATNQTDIVNLKAQKYGADLSYTDNQLQLLDQDGNAIGKAVEITSGGGSVDVDNLSITENTSGQIQTVGVIDQNNTTNAIKTWSGTKAQYDAIATKDANTLYNITDDTDLGLNLLQTLYPVGSIYIGVMSVCPLGSLFGTWTKVASDRVLQGAGTRGVVGSTVEESLPNITGYFNSGSNSTTSGGAFVTNNVTATGAGSTGNVSGQLDFNASRSSSTYQDNAPVQQDAYLVNIWQRIA